MWAELRADVRPFVARRVPPADVDDVVQDVMVRVQIGLPGLRDPSRLWPWALQAARCAVGSYWEMRRRHPLATDRESPACDEPAPEQPDDSGRRCMARYLLAQVQELPDAYRQAVTLAELEGRSVQKAAEVAGVSLSAMKSRLRRGRLLLRQRADACCRVERDGRAWVMDCEPQTSPCSC